MADSNGYCEEICIQYSVDDRKDFELLKMKFRTVSLYRFLDYIYTYTWTTCALNFNALYRFYIFNCNRSTDYICIYRGNVERSSCEILSF